MTAMAVRLMIGGGVLIGLGVLLALVNRALPLGGEPRGMIWVAGIGICMGISLMTTAVAFLMNRWAGAMVAVSTIMVWVLSLHARFRSVSGMCTQSEMRFAGLGECFILILGIGALLACVRWSCKYK